jgi:hypothetical protein
LSTPAKPESQQSIDHISAMGTVDTSASAASVGSKILRS